MSLKFLTYLNMEWWRYNKWQIKLHLLDWSVLPINICIILKFSNTTFTEFFFFFFFCMKKIGMNPLLVDYQL